MRNEEGGGIPIVVGRLLSEEGENITNVDGGKFKSRREEGS